MAGRFLTLEETALQLGVEPEEVNRLVDRKKLFPMRDGGTMKFRQDDVARYAETSGESSDMQSGLSLDLDASLSAGPASGSVSMGSVSMGSVSMGSVSMGSAPSGSAAAADATGLSGASGLGLDDIKLDDLQLGDAIGDGGSIFDDAPAGGSKDVSETVLRGGSLASSGVAIGSGLSLAGGSNVSGIGAEPRGDDLVIESLAIGSSPGTSKPVSGAGSAAGSGRTAAISDLAGVTGISDGAGLSVAGASGLSLEDDDVQLSGIQLSGIDASGAGGVSGVDDEAGVDLGAVGDDGGDLEGRTMLAGDAFELGEISGDDESASVVIATDSESGDSSFFGSAMGGGDSSSSEDSSNLAGTSGLQIPMESFHGTSFSALQICGLICCSLLLMVGGFICFDVIRSIGSMRGTSLSTPILDSLTSTFGLK